MNKEQMIQEVHNYLKNNGFSYDFKEKHSVFIVPFNSGSIIGSFRFFIIVNDTDISCYALLPSTTRRKLQETSEFLSRVNYNLKYGNFELDFNYGEIRYKNIISSADMAVDAQKACDLLVAVPTVMINRYGDALQKVLLGVSTPEEAVMEVESQK